MHASARLGLLAALTACGGNGTTTPQPDADPNPPDAAPGMNTILGDVGGSPFTSTMTVLRAGSPDVSSTTVVYMFDHAVQCSELGAIGWDKRVQDRTQALEIKLLGTAVKTYRIPQNEAFINYTLTSMTGTPVESVASGGTGTLEVAVGDGTRAQGNFDVTFASGHLAGRFDAVFCPGGKEP